MMIADYDPLIVFNEKISTINDKVQYETNQLRVFLNKLLNQTQKDSEIREKHCEVCLARHVSFEKHHVAGRKHNFRQITVCIPCHNILTLRQQLWDDRWLHDTDSETLKMSFLYHGVHDILKLISEKRQDSLYSQVADSLVYTTAYLQKGAQN